MSDPIGVYTFVDRFFAALAAGGVEHAVVSPGSRSTPLALGADRTPGLRLWIQLDERSAGFFALGLARATRRPVALICTSGTAAANYLPAVVEAHHGRVPLLALTADRPPELRDWGAGQTIEQSGLYGSYPRWSVEVPLATTGADAERYAARLAARAIEKSLGPPAGPVHLNWPFREPLEPVPSDPDAPSERESPVGRDRGIRFSDARRVAIQADVVELVELVRREPRGVIAAGPMAATPELVAALREFAAASGWPVLADPASQLRSGGTAADPVLALGDAILRAEHFAARHSPRVVVRVGDTPVSKAQRLWIERAEPESVWWLDEGGQWGEPSHRATRVVRGGAATLLVAASRALGSPSPRESDWMHDFRAAESAAERAFEGWLDERARSRGAALSGLAVARWVGETLSAGDLLFASNSMAIRWLDLGLPKRSDPLRVLVNRGASGIDGVTSTALGSAATLPPGRRAVLLTGDLAFLHDLGGLWITRHEAIDCTLVVLDDDGGGIFSFLPIATAADPTSFERLFRTPHGLDLSRAATLFGLAYHRAETRETLIDALSRAREEGGVAIVHVPIAAVHGVAELRDALSRMTTAVEAVLDPSPDDGSAG